MTYRILVLLLVLGLFSAANAASSDSTPKATFLKYWQALKDKDVEGIKKSLAQEDLKRLSEAPIPIDGILLSLAKDAPATAPEVRNEKITGSTATLEYYDSNNKTWDRCSFVKEAGAWKITMSKEE